MVLDVPLDEMLILSSAKTGSTKIEDFSLSRFSVKVTGPCGNTDLFLPMLGEGRFVVAGAVVAYTIEVMLECDVAVAADVKAVIAVAAFEGNIIIQRISISHRAAGKKPR